MHWKSEEIEQMRRIHYFFAGTMERAKGNEITSTFRAWLLKINRLFKYSGEQPGRLALQQIKPSLFVLEMGEDRKG